MRRIPVVLLIAVLALPGRATAQGASMSVGDEVVFSGGPSQPPKSIQTGLIVEYSSIRGDFGGQKPSGAKAPATVASPAADAAPALPQYGSMTTDDVAAAMGDADPAHRQAAAEALAARNADADRPSAVAALSGALSDQDPGVVQRAAAGLARLGDASAAPSVMPLVYDRDDGTATAAIRAVATLRYAAAIPELAKLADRDLGPVGQAARQAVVDLKRPPAPAPSPAAPPAPGH